MKIKQKLQEFYYKWKIYLQVDLLMYLFILLFIIFLFVFFGK